MIVVKSLLITGANSYIGTNLARWLGAFGDQFQVATLDLLDDAWRAHDFAPYAAVVHVAGIAHVPAGSSSADRYFKVNRDLALETATRARAAGVGQFVFMSSIIVYGDNAGPRGMIDAHTSPAPRDHYGQSKLDAEAGLRQLAADDFKVAIIRSPMVYGRGSKGNYPRLAAAARRLPFFPEYDNRRSMVHIDNLCEFIRLLVVHEDGGVFFPQNREHVKTSDLVRAIAAARGKRLLLVKGAGPLIGLLVKRCELFRKVFGNLAYEMSMSAYQADYRVRSFAESIAATEATSDETR